MAPSMTSNTNTELSFEAKYYGACPELSAATDAPDLDHAVLIMASRKSAGTVMRCNLTFTEKGAAVKQRKSGAVLESWLGSSMASCATADLPNSKTRRIGLLKILEPETGVLTWHLFKYYFHKRDNMTECFRFVVDCGLRELGRAYASQVAQHSQPAEDYTIPPAWPAPVPPPYGQNEDELEAADLASSADRATLLSDDGLGPSGGYLEVTAAY